LRGSEIADVYAREILDGEGRPTIEAEVKTGSGAVGRASSPCGTSKGKYESYFLRDENTRYRGLGVRKAVRNVIEVIGPELIGKDVTRQSELDELMIRLDGTLNKSRLGANSMLSVSLAIAKAACATLNVPLYSYLGTKSIVIPVPMINLVTGGPHSASDLGFQEHLIMPINADTYQEALMMSVEVYLELGNILQKKYGKRGIARDHAAGYAPPISDTREVFDRILEAVEQVGWEGRFGLCLDCAASNIYDETTDTYTYIGRKVSREGMIEVYDDLVRTYPLVSIEDPLNEDDFEGHATLTRELGIQVAGDDLFSTNWNRLLKGIEVGACNALILKPNQIGTLTEVVKVRRFALENQFQVIAASRSGELEDTIADIAVGLGCGQCKFGAPASGERTTRYNRLLRVEEGLGDSARLAEVRMRRSCA
jgi:enolase